MHIRRTVRVQSISGPDITLEGGVSLTGWTLAAALEGTEHVEIGLTDEPLPEGALDEGCSGLNPNDRHALIELLREVSPGLQDRGEPYLRPCTGALGRAEGRSPSSG